MDDEVIVVRTNQPQPEPPFPEGITFTVIDSASDALPLMPAYARVHGWRDAVKMVAKCATSRRSYWVARRGHAILSDGWMLKGRYRTHPIDPGDWVLQSMATVPEARGMNLSHLCLVRAINECLRRGAVWVYGDTTRANVASYKSCMKSGLRPI